MAIVTVKMDVPDNLYTEIMAGKVILKGLVKNAGNKRIRKHIDLVPMSAKEQAIQAVKANKNIIVGVGIAFGILLVAGITYLFHRNKKKKADDKTIEFSNSLKAYLSEAKDGQLDYETLNNLIVALEGLQNSKNGNLENLNLSPAQLNTLIKSVFDYTKALAKANDVDVKDIKKPSRKQKDKVVDLMSYLETQKKIIEQAA